MAKAHIVGAFFSGANGVKFQLFRGETLDARQEVQAQLVPYELPLEWLYSLSMHAHTLGLAFGVTPFAVDLVEPLRGLVDFVKVSAYDLTFDDLLYAVVDLNVPVVLSTAMATIDEITHAVALLKSTRLSEDIVLLHGVAAYPAALTDHNLLSLHRLREYGVRYGLSDHTYGHEAAVIATALGATWIEKHFRSEDAPQNPDYTVSADSLAFTAMSEAVRQTLAALGDGERQGPLPLEMPLFTTCRRSNEKRKRG